MPNESVSFQTALYDGRTPNAIVVSERQPRTDAFEK